MKKVFRYSPRRMSNTLRQNRTNDDIQRVRCTNEGSTIPPLDFRRVFAYHWRIKSERSSAMALPNTIHCGPAGWVYPHWNGVVYPKAKPRGFHPLEYLS